MVVYYEREVLTMPADPIRRADARRTQTPNATMTTLASPTLGATAGLSLWRIEMAAGQRGPLHSFDSEQLWTVTAGELSIAVDGSPVALAQGDTLVLAGAAERQVRAVSDAVVLVCGHGDAVVTVAGEDESRGTPPWIG